MKLLIASLLALVAVVHSRNINLEDVIELEKRAASRYENSFEADEDPSRIFGGSLAALGQFPYQAGLVMVNPDGQNSIGSAVLLSSTRVLTAAHNWNDGFIQKVRLTVVLGTNALGFTSGGVRRDTATVILHENYVPVHLGLRNDIAMIIMPTPVTFSNVLAPITLPSASDVNQDFVGQTAIATGYGVRFDGAGVPNNQPLSFVTLPVITNQVCQQSFASGSIQPWVLCADSPTGNICSGDSGGPLAILRNQVPVLIGITSFGTWGCDASGPSGFTRVTFFRDWILNQM